MLIHYSCKLDFIMYLLRHIYFIDYALPDLSASSINDTFLTNFSGQILPHHLKQNFFATFPKINQQIQIT